MADKIKQALDSLNKKHGQGTIGRLSDLKFGVYDRIPTGSLGLDIATGGGYPVGRIIQLKGWESTGKTTICLHALAETQKKFPDKAMAFIDTEYSFDKTYAESLGVDVDNLIVSQPDHGEEAFDTIKTLVKTGECSIIVLDSLASALPEAIMEAEAGDSIIGLHARLVSGELPKLAGACEKTKTTFFITNQLRNKIGGYGSNEVESGGNALKFYSSMILDQSRSISKQNAGTDDQGDIISNPHKTRVVKNKTAPPFREAHYDIRFGEGIDIYGEILDYAVALELVKKSGSWYSHEDMKLGQGRGSVRDLLKDNEGLAQELLTEIKKAYGI